MKIKAAICWEPQKPLEVDEIELQGPRAGECLVRLVASGVCHSCLHAADGSWGNTKVPTVLGDEGAGIVERVGPW